MTFRVFRMTFRVSRFFYLFFCLGLLVTGGVASPRSTRAEDAVSLCPDVQNPQKIPPDFSFIRDMAVGKDGWIFSRRDTAQAPALTPATKDSLARLHQALQRHGTQLVLAVIPNRLLINAGEATPAILQRAAFDPVASETAFHTRLQEVRAAGVVAPDMLESLRARAPLGPVFFKRDHHWTPLGAERMAAVVAVALAPLPSFQALPPHTFLTYPAGEEDYAGYYTRLIETVCHTPVARETLALYQSPPLPQGSPSAQGSPSTQGLPSAQGSPSATALMGEAAPASVVLAGTSFSNNEGKDRFNFAGFLRRALKQDVLNVAVAGGGSGAALLSWINSGLQEKTRPAFLIWEMPGEYDLNRPELFRQLVPATLGACGPSRTLTSAAVILKPGRVSLFTLPPSQGITGGRDYVVLNTTDRALARFTLSFRYRNGKTDFFSVERSTRTAWNGRTFVESDSRYGNDLAEVRLETTDAVTGPLNATLCQAP